MKTLRLLILGLVMATIRCAGQGLLVTNSGWFPVNYYDALVTNDPTGGGGAQAGGGTSATPPAIAEAITPDIQALANGLQNNPLRIFNYVHDHIRYELYFGSKKGAEITYLEKSGNDFDQCALLVAMLRAAGYTNSQFANNGVGYQFSWMKIPFDATDGTVMDLHHLLGLNFNNTDWSSTVAYLQTLFTGWRNYPLNAVWAEGNNEFEFPRVWVTLTTNGTNYCLDPSFKVSEPIQGISLPTAMGSSSSSISNSLMNAVGFGTFFDDWHPSAIFSDLTGYASNLLNSIQGAYPNASVDQVSGGEQIIPSTSTSLSQATLFPVDAFFFPGQDDFTNWFNEPTNFMSTLQVKFAGGTYQWYFPQLEGQRLSLVYGSSTAQLWLGDSNVASGSFSSSDSVTLTVHHPYQGNWATTNNSYLPGAGYTSSSTKTYYANSDYAILYSFEPDWGWLQERENQLDVYRQQGYPNNSRQVATETLNIMGLDWEIQTRYVEQMLGQEIGVLPLWFQKVGRMGQEAGRGYYVDVYMATHCTANNTGQACMAGCDVNSDNWQNLISYFDSALEHGMIEQLQASNLVAASTVKIIETAAANNEPIYLATAANWSMIQTNLTNYTISDLTGLINAGDDLLLPQNGHTAMTGGTNGWTGYGFMAWATNSYGIQMLIAPGTYGGYAGELDAFPNPDFVDYSAYSQPVYFSSDPFALPLITAADPVDMVDGTFQVESDDLSLGQAEPRGISFSRYYNTTRRFSNLAGMSPGWLHNYYMNAATISSPEACLGGTTPAQAASMLAATAAAVAVYNSQPNAPNGVNNNWVLTALIAKWAIDQLKATAVSVNLGQNTLQFIQQPTGVFTPPADCTMTLTQTNGCYLLRERHGRTYQFNGAGCVTNIVDPYGNSLSLMYNSSNLVKTVTDWKGRTLTFNYATSNLISVVDSAGRTNAYGYSGGNLTSSTDPEGKTSTYTYDTNHDIIATFNAAGQMVASNVYNVFGRITRQYTEGLTNKLWQIFWSGWQTVQIDPAGDQTSYFYDDQSREVGLLDPLNNFTQKFYDGQDHVVLTVSPMDEANQFIYDGNNNLIETIDPLGDTNQLVYDGNNNLIESIDARGDVSTYGYNTEYSLIGQTNGAGDWVNCAYNSDGTLYSETDPGGTTKFGYDSYGQLDNITYPNGLGSESFVNDPLGDVTSHTDGNGNVTSLYYNSRRQLTNTIAPGNIVSTITYDPVGNAVRVADPRNNVTANLWSATRHVLTTTMPATPQGTPVVTNVYDNRDWLFGIVDPLKNQAVYTNDFDERLTSTTDPLSRTATLSYDGDGRQTQAANPAGETTSQTWDARGRLTGLTDGAGHTSLRAYDGAGDQITLTNRNGHAWHFQFDAANRLTNTISPLGRSAGVVFDHRGLPITMRDPAGQFTTCYYDAKGRLTNRVDDVGSIIYAYDPNDNLTNISQTASGQQSSIDYTYDSYNRVSSYTDVYGNQIQYRYDAGGNMTNLIYPGGRNVYYAFDGLNRLTNVTDWAGRQTSFTYDLASRLVSTRRPNGTYRTMNYDAAGELTNVLEQMANTLPIALMRYAWNSNSTMHSEFVAPLPPTNAMPTRTMTYDDDNELTNVDGNPVSVDNDGNLVSGPLTNDTFVSYQYDARNRLTNGAGVVNVYDAADDRIAQAFGTNSIAYIINPNSQIPEVLERIKNGVTTYYVYGPGLLYQVTETPTSTNTLTYHYDYRGSTIALTTDSGLVADRMAYSAYGTLTYRAGTDDIPFLFNGKYGVMSDPNGLLYMQSRYYNPFLCRFLNPDPSGFNGGLNFYAYANGNPITYLDPFGLGAINDNMVIPSWVQAPTPEQKQIGQFLAGIVNLATLGAANLISSATTGRDLMGEQLNTDDAFEQSLETAAFAGSLVTALPTDGASLEADAVLEGTDVGLGDFASDLTPLENAGGARNSAGLTGQVGYGSSDLSQIAIAYRQSAGISGGRNVAVFEYQNADGSLQTLAAASERGVGHAERIVAGQVSEMGISPSQVTRIYSELQPCNMPGGYCSSFVQHTFPQANVTWSFEYGATAESRAAGVAALRNAVQNLAQ